MARESDGDSRLAAGLSMALQAATDAQRQIVRAATDLRQAIGVRDAVRLAAAVDGERAALAVAAEADATLRSAVGDLTVALGLPATTALPAVVSLLARRGHRRQAACLAAARQTLAEEMERARQANAGNAVLLRQAIALTTLALRHLTAGGGDAQAYTPAGLASGAGPYRVLDARA